MVEYIFYFRNNSPLIVPIYPALCNNLLITIVLLPSEYI